MGLAVPKQPEPPKAELAVVPPAKPEKPAKSVPDSKAAEAHNQRGRELLQQNKYAEAIEELSAAIEAQPGFALAYNARGFARYLTKDYKNALADLDEAVRLNPQVSERVSRIDPSCAELSATSGGRRRRPGHGKNNSPLINLTSTKPLLH